MTNDRFSRLLLSIIALSLAVIAVRGILPDAIASSGNMKCEIVGTVNVAGKVGIDTYNNALLVKADNEFPVKVRDTVSVRVDRVETVPVKVERVDGTVQVRNN